MIYYRIRQLLPLLLPVKISRTLNVLLVLLLFCSFAYAENATQQYYTEAEIPERVVNEFYEKYSQDIPVFLNIQAGKFTPAIYSLLKQRLFEDSLDIYEIRPETCLKIELTYRPERERIIQKRWLKNKETIRIYHNFSYQVTSYPKGKVISYDTLKIESRPEKAGNTLQWYDPLFISAIVGGLVYLVYFGL